MATFDELFDPPLMQWHLRGDPVLWELMLRHLYGREIPEYDVSARKILEDAYEEIVGQKLPGRPDLDDNIVDERFDGGEGMSAGVINPHFWRHTAIPILLDRALNRTGVGWKVWPSMAPPHLWRTPPRTLVPPDTDSTGPGGGTDRDETAVRGFPELPPWLTDGRR